MPKLNAFVQRYGISFDITMRLIELDLVTWGYLPTQAEQYPYIEIDVHTYYAMQALKKRKESFIKKLKGNLITYQEAYSILGRIDQLILDRIITVQYPKVRYPYKKNKHAVFIVVDSWFMEYARYIKVIKWDETHETIVNKALEATLNKLLINY
jgi:hypothetical protein